jgi:hypothetical protein
MAVASSILLGTAIAGMGVSAYGSYKSGKAAQAAANSDAQRLEFNAQVADAQAQDALERGVEEESRFKQNVRRLIGTQRAAFAGGGVAVNVGSARDVRADTEYLAQLDVEQIRSNAEREAWGHRVESSDLRMQADVARRGGKSAASAGKWAAGGTLLSGGSMLLDRYGYGRTTQRAA